MRYDLFRRCLGAMRKHELISKSLRTMRTRHHLWQRSAEILPDNFLASCVRLITTTRHVRRHLRFTFANCRLLRTGDFVEGEIRSPKDKERFFALLR